tara:strand:- start:559 stop:2328 length:1770 start_codon:yes stop_codon:yes gene_type:complete
MLSIIFLWGLIIFCSVPIGLFILNNLKVSFLSRSFDRFIISFWIGISIISLIQLFLSGWFVLNFWFPLAFSLFSLALLQNTKVKLEFTKWWKTFFHQRSIFLGGVFLLFSSAFYMVNSPIVWDDSGGYHIGNIEWLSQYGMTYGIGLIHHRLAILSSWNTVVASFNHALFEHRVFSITNGLVLFLLLLQIVVLLKRLSSNRRGISDFYLLIFIGSVLMISLYKKMFHSASSDIPIYFVTIFVSWSIILLLEAKKENKGEVMGIELPYLLSSFAVGYKFFIAPVVVVTFVLYFFLSKSKIRSIFFSFVLGVIVLAIIASSGYKASGCFWFPVSICIESPWSVGQQEASRFSKESIDAAVDALGRVPKDKINSISWIWYWAKATKSNFIAFVLLLLSTILFFKGILTRSEDRHPAMYWLLFMGFSGLSFLLLNSPDPRYNWSYFLVIPSTIPIIFSKYILRTKGFVFSYFSVFVLISIFIILVSFKKDPLFYEEKLLNMIETGRIKNAKQETNIFYPPKIIPFSQNRVSHTEFELEPFKLIKKKAGDLDYYLPNTGKSCWNAPLPCAHMIIKENLKLKNPKEGLLGGIVRQ